MSESKNIPNNPGPDTADAQARQDPLSEYPSLFPTQVRGSTADGTWPDDGDRIAGLHGTMEHSALETGGENIA